MDGTVVCRFGNVSFVNELKKTFFASWSRGDLARGVWGWSVLRLNFLTINKPKNRFQRINFASLCFLAGRYDNPIPTRFLAPVDC
jgi:hypothetical protein